MPLNPQERLAMAAMIVDCQPEDAKTFVIAVEMKSGGINVFLPCGHQSCGVEMLTKCVGFMATGHDVTIMPMENRDDNE